MSDLLPKSPPGPAPGGRKMVDVRGLTKTFRGLPASERLTWSTALRRRAERLFRPPEKRTVLDGVTLDVEEGEFFGIVGGNGAGKTTLMKLLACLLYPDGGEGTVVGHDIYRRRSAIRRSVAISKAQAWNGLGILWQLTCRENLQFRGRLAGLTGPEARRRSDYVLDRLEISDKGDSHTWEMSTGERQRLSLGMTFVTGAPLVMLDEPTANLDPPTARVVREFAWEHLCRRHGQTVILATHFLEEADLLCDRVAVMRQGRLLALGAPRELKRRYLPEPILELRTLDYRPEVGKRLRESCRLDDLIEHFEDVVTGEARLRPKRREGSPDAAELETNLKKEGVTVISSAYVEPTMDDVYFHLARESAA